MLKRIALLFLLCSIITPFAANAQDVEPHVQAAISDLSSRLGVPLTSNDISRWTFAENRYPDSSYGCPTAPDAPYTPGSFTAYQVTLIHQAIAYDYRVASDLSWIFLCGEAAPVQPTVDASLTPILPTFTPVIQPTTDPSIACPAGYPGYLMPRLQIGGQGQVPVGSTPNRLRETPSLTGAQIGLLGSGAAFTIIGGPACADGIVWWQVAINDQTGWTAEGQLPDTYYVEPASVVPTATASILPTFTPVAEQPTPAPEPLLLDVLPALAGQLGGSLQFYAYQDGAAVANYSVPIPNPNQSDAFVTHIEFAPDGLSATFAVLSYIPDGGPVINIYRASLETSLVEQIAADTYLAMPFDYDAGGQNIIYAARDEANPYTDGSETTGPGGENIIFYALPVDASAPPQEIGRAIFGVGCGGGSPYPGTSALWNESGYGTRPLMLETTPYGLVYSTNCTGSGAALLDLESGESAELGGYLANLSVSSDGQQVLGVQEEGGDPNTGVLTLIDLESGEISELDTSAIPDVTAFAADGSGTFYYSSRAVSRVIDASDVPALTAMQLGEIDANTVSIYHIDGEAEQLVYQGDAYGLGRLLTSAAGELFFSLIPNGDNWVQAVRDGIETDQPFAQVIRTYFPIELLVIDASGDAISLVSGLEQAAINPMALGSAAG
ncbi:MAG: SH3 domain-containing protein [Anaerolineae bacterium]|nr:SH3 domain-containing protein [Anaerolineae bacterium]